MRAREKVFLAVVGIALVAAIVPTFTGQKTAPVSKAQSTLPEPDSVMYAIKFAQYGTVTYNNAEGGTEQADFHGAWSKVVYPAQKPFYAYVSAQTTAGYDIIAVEISSNGKVVRHSESTGNYVSAQASVVVN